MVLELVLFWVFAIGLPVYLLGEEVLHRLRARRGVAERPARARRAAPYARTIAPLRHAS